jgi:hypothetical protein
MTEKLKEHLDWSIDTDMGEKKPIAYSNLRNKGFVNLHGIAAIELPSFLKDYTLFYENDKCYAIPVVYKKENVNSQTISDDEHVFV